MDEQSVEIDNITHCSAPPSFENTIVAMEESGALFKRVAGVFYAMTGVMSDSTIQAIESEISPLVTEHDDNIFMNVKLFARIKVVYDASESGNLTTEQRMLLRKYYRAFIRSGILLKADQKARLREINRELSLLTIKFGDNLLAETYGYRMVIDRKEDLSGLPDDAIDQAAVAAREAGLAGKWLFTLSKPSWEPFLRYADNRALRETLYKAMYNRCNNDNEYDNKEIIRKIVNLRLEKANLLGYDTHAQYRLEESMAKTPTAAFKLLTDIWKYALPQSIRERDELQGLIDSEGGQFRLRAWDWFYYAEKFRLSKYAFDELGIRAWFPVEGVLGGAFEVANRLYGISFREIADAPVYHEEVKVYDVTDVSGAHIGYIYFDYFPRPSKRNGAWMGNFTDQAVIGGLDIRPVVYNVGNFAPPSGNSPSLLTVDQVETLFHEFGHALHGLLSSCHYESVSGTSVYRDFVELPSQIYEHWAFHPEVLKLYAKHYLTGSTIPDSLVGKINTAATFNRGFATSELIAAAILDLKWHSLEAPFEGSIGAFEEAAMNQIGLIGEIIPRYRSTYFSHIFDGGYSAGYYSYLWSEVLDADAFKAFEENGIFDRATADLFMENILSRGGSDDPERLYIKFRGKAPDPKHLLVNRGFIND
jgi:peptidyl-dipeptidase Dcp